MFETVQKIIAEKMDIEPEEITMDSTFEALKIDSLDMVEITMDLEEAFEITIEKNDGLDSVASLIAYIEEIKG